MFIRHWRDGVYTSLKGANELDCVLLSRITLSRDQCVRKERKICVCNSGGGGGGEG